jgi:tyrosyl-tRNA synthetase
MKLSEDLQWRGLIKDKTFEEVTWLDEPKTFYLGADCASADSLTIGNLAIFLVARRLIEAGWKAVLLVGGATSLIGDPGGKEAERDLKTRDEIAQNVAGIKTQVQRIFAEQEFELVDNYDWFKDVGYLEFLREIGKHYSMTELVQRDFIASRMGDNGGGISYAEFSYSLIQGYDYWHLFKTHGVVLQIGGSDQWGNMLSGVPLIRKKEGKEAQAFSMPLVINKATGRKFGKSEDGAVWLDPSKTSPTQFYQFWINADDADVEDYLKVYTFLSEKEITATMAEHVKNPAGRYAQKALATEVTTLVHGITETHTAQVVTDVLTGKTTIGSVTREVVDAMHQEVASVAATDHDSIVNVLVSSGLAESNTEARRLLQGNAIAINGQKVNRETLEPFDFQNGYLLLRKGKKFKDTALVAVEATII